MSGQYKIMYSSMDQFYDQTNGRMAEWVSQLEPWVKACENLGNMECYQGKSAESVKTYLKEVHMTLLTSIQQAIQLYRTKYLFYREGYYDIEGDLYAVIPQKTLLSVKDRMKTEIEDVSDSSLIVQTSLLNVSDLIALQAPNSYYLKDSMEEVKQNVTDFNQNIIDYEAQHKSEANGELADLLQSLFATLTEYYTNGTNVTSYQSGDCFGNSHMPELCQHVLTANEYLKENAEEIELAEVKMQEVFAQQYEDACKAREEEGAIKLLTGGAAAITGILAIVGTGGMATPVVIGVWVTGGSTALYGASKAIEGIQDVHYGSFLHPKTDADSAKTATFTNQEAEDLAFGAIKGKGKSDAVVLGKFEDGKSTSYDKIAQEYDAQYYNLDEWDELAKTYSRDEMWKVNEKFLDIEIASGRDIYLSHDPAKFSGDGSFFAKEIEYLRQHGYKFVKEGDLWHAVQ